MPEKRGALDVQEELHRRARLRGAISLRQFLPSVYSGVGDGGYETGGDSKDVNFE